MDNIQGIPAKMLQASRKNRIRLDDSEAHRMSGQKRIQQTGSQKTDHCPWESFLWATFFY